MELDQLLYKRISSYFSKRKKRPTEEVLNRTVHIEKYIDQWVVLAQSLTGKNIKINAAEKEGGWKDFTFFLPSSFCLLDSKELNYQYYLFRIIYMSVMFNNARHFNLSQTTHMIVEDSLINRTVLPKVFKQFPLLEKYYDTLSRAFLKISENNIDHQVDNWLFGKWMPCSLSIDELKDNSDEFGPEALPTAKTEIKAKPVDEVESLTVDKKSQEEYTLIHNFEKVETVEEFSGLWRDFDGDDELEEHREALDHINMKHTVRVDNETHSIYQSDFISNATIPESKNTSIEEGEKCYLYNEWNYAKLKYRKNYCKVFEKRSTTKNKDYINSTLEDHKIAIRVLKKKLASFFNRLTEIKNLNQGEQIDIDALTDMFIDHEANKTPSDKIYTSKRYRRKDISILFLLDLSLSSDGYAGGNRILDVEKQMAIIIGEVLNEYNIPFQIDGFSSKTRNYCSYTIFKSFADKWSKSKSVIGSITPRGYTRIGPAIRHAGTILQQQPTTKKWLVILSDGKPNDYDKYEGTYGVADVKQAIRELHESHIGVHTFAIDKKAKFYLPQIFGKSNYNVLAHPNEMLLSMIQFCQRIMTV